MIKGNTSPRKSSSKPRSPNLNPDSQKFGRLHSMNFTTFKVKPTQTQSVMSRSRTIMNQQLSDGDDDTTITSINLKNENNEEENFGLINMSYVLKFIGEELDERLEIIGKKVKKVDMILNNLSFK